MNVLKALARDGMVDSTRGQRGGYRLRREAGTITLLEVIDVIEGGVHLFQCGSSGDADHAADEGPGCDIEPWCPMSGSARHVNGRFREFLSGITLAEIVAARKAGTTPLQLRISPPVMAETE
jgi:Rrf2 family protein